jgi:superfamily I DNA/RNA helicase
MATTAAATDRIGDLLVREGLITAQQLTAALQDARKENTRIGYSLIKLGFIAEADLTRMLARQYRVPAVDLERVTVDPKIIKLVPADLAHKHLVLPLRRVGRTLTLAMANPIAGEDVAVVGPEDEKIVLSSVHQAKGLEWRIVFVIWLADGRFPSQRALRVPGGIIRIAPGRVHEALPLLEGATADAPVIDDAGTRELMIPGEEEERRLFYVAVTRAMQELYLVFPVMARDRGGMDILMEPSRFVRELPDDSYEKWVIGSE